MNEKYDARKAEEFVRKTKDKNLHVNVNDTKFGEVYNRFKRGVNYGSRKEDNKCE